MPAWVRTLCPNVESLTVLDCTLAAHPERVSATPAAAGLAPPTLPAMPLPAPFTCGRLRDLKLLHGFVAGLADGPALDLVRRQLAALPSLASLTAGVEDIMALDDGGVLSASVTTITAEHLSFRPSLPHVRTLFPALRAMDAVLLHAVGDVELEGLLRDMGHIDVHFQRFSLTQSFTHRAWPWPHLKVWQLDVYSFARLPLHNILSCRCKAEGSLPSVQPSRDAQAVARVTEAIRRWGGLGTGRGDVLHVDAEDQGALLTTLGPLLAALPEGQRRHINLRSVRGEVAPDFLRRLGAALPPAVAQLSLRLWEANVAPAAWRALHLSLPAMVEQVDLYGLGLTEDLVDVARAATRRVTVRVRDNTAEHVVAAWNARLAGVRAGQEPLVTVEASERW